jgi:hypothetical protein
VFVCAFALLLAAKEGRARVGFDSIGGQLCDDDDGDGISSTHVDLFV